jgi:hypothetical protein
MWDCSQEDEFEIDSLEILEISMFPNDIASRQGLDKSPEDAIDSFF